jgi:hypothetical protein
MVSIEADGHVEDKLVITVVVGTEDQDITLARDAEQMVLVYDESMEPPPRQGDDNALVNDLARI